MRHDKLFDAVAQPGDSPQKLAARLECEATAGKPFEGPLREEITAFRKLRTDARVSAAKTYLMRALAGLASQFVKASDDRRTNFLVIPSAEEPEKVDMVSLGRHEHIIDAKAEWADLVWLTQTLLHIGQQTVLGNTLDINQLTGMKCGHCGTPGHKCEGLVMNSRCHPQAGTKVVYQAETKRLSVSCDICGAFIVAFKSVVPEP